MKKIFEQFGDFSLSKQDMKEIKGGSCYMTYVSPSGNYSVYKGSSYSKKEAKSISGWHVSKFGAGYGWCCNSSC